jgi:hypothetical protein
MLRQAAKDAARHWPRMRVDGAALATDETRRWRIVPEGYAGESPHREAIPRNMRLCGQGRALRSPAVSTVSAIFVNHVAILPRPPTGLPGNVWAGSAQNSTPSLPIADMEATDGLGAGLDPAAVDRPIFSAPGEPAINPPTVCGTAGKATFTPARPMSYSRQPGKALRTHLPPVSGPATRLFGQGCLVSRAGTGMCSRRLLLFILASARGDSFCYA